MQSDRTVIIWIFWILVALCVPSTAFAICWIKLPAWVPGLVIRHSPFIDPVFRAMQTSARDVAALGHYREEVEFFSRVARWGHAVEPRIISSLINDHEADHNAGIIACAALLDNKIIPINPKLANAVTPFLQHPSPMYRSIAGATLAKMHVIDAVPAIIARLHIEDDIQVGRSLLYTLGHFRDLRSLPLIREITKGDHPHLFTNEIIADALAQWVEIDRDGGIEQLFMALRHPHWGIRVTAVVALGELKPKGSVDALLPLLQDDHLVVQQRAASALVWLRDPRTFDALISSAPSLLFERNIGPENEFRYRDFRIEAQDLVKEIEALPLSDAQRQRWNQALIKK